MAFPTLDKIKLFQNEILLWYPKNRRDLPWRRTRDPYQILLSEVMLQQTQVSRVIPKFFAWLDKFPTIDSLANANRAVILELWSGLGYNRRALYLQKFAKIVTERYKNIFPKTYNELIELPGIGEYTANAILCFAFDQQVAVIDTNVRKVISLQFFQGIPPDTKMIRKMANMLLPSGKAYEWNQALMDYSSLMLKDKKVPVQKQSKFIGSHRYYRGKILKLLLIHKSLSLIALGKLLKNDFTQNEMEWMNNFIEELRNEGFIQQEGNIIILAS